MNESFTEVDAYFNGQLSADEKLQFEQRLQTDQQLAEDVALYIAARSHMRTELLDKKVKEWQAADVVSMHEDESIEKQLHKVFFIKRQDWKRWIPGIAAAIMVLAIAGYFFETKDTPNKLADNFMKKNYPTLSNTMDGSTDSIQTGISFYKKEQYDSAIKIFHQFYMAHPESSEVKKYEGLAYYRQARYDDAIEAFGELATIKNLYSNPGHFLQAVALIKRNKPGDRSQARQLLATVKNNNEAYSNEADEWLQKLE